jgi:hypothetical protein
MSMGTVPFDPAANPYYCTDEDIAIESSRDWSVLCPADQADFRVADGILDPALPWSMLSIAVNFALAGLTPGKIVTLTGPADPFQNGESFAFDHIDESNPHILYLRRKGKPSGAGMPPGNGAMIQGVAAECVTLAPQIYKASREIEDELGIQAAIESGRPALISPRDVTNLADATACMVLHRQYLAIGQLGVIPGAKDNFMEKSRIYQDRYVAVFRKLSYSLTDTNQALTTRRRIVRVYRA